MKKHTMLFIKAFAILTITLQLKPAASSGNQSSNFTMTFTGQKAQEAFEKHQANSQAEAKEQQAIETLYKDLLQAFNQEPQQENNVMPPKKSAAVRVVDQAELTLRKQFIAAQEKHIADIKAKKQFMQNSRLRPFLQVRFLAATKDVTDEKNLYEYFKFFFDLETLMNENENTLWLENQRLAKLYDALLPEEK